MTVVRLDPYQNIVNVHWRETTAYAGPWYRIARKLIDRSGEDFPGQGDFAESMDPLSSITKAQAEWLNGVVWDEAHKADALLAFNAYDLAPATYAVYLMVFDDPFTDPPLTAPADDLNDSHWNQYTPAEDSFAGYKRGDIHYCVVLGATDTDPPLPQNACPSDAYGPASGRWYITEDSANAEVAYLISTGGLESVFGPSSATVMGGSSKTETPDGTPLSCTLYEP